MKRFLLFLLLLTVSGPLWAYDFKVDGIAYGITSSSEKTVYVTSGSTYSETINIPNKVVYNGTTYTVTSIGDDAFNGYSNLTSITIPNSITSIGKRAFNKCSRLTSITIPNSVTNIGESAFSYCIRLTSITIPNSITTIENDTFSTCSRLTTITIPNSVTSIGDFAFNACDGLTSVTIPNSVTNIGRYAFSYCDGLTSVTIPNSVTSIEDHTFFECPSLTTITIPNSVTNIEEYAFYKCSSLTTITIPNSVTSIGKFAFYYCDGLTSVTIGDSVTSIGEYAFSECSRLTTITIPNSVTSIGRYAFNYCYGLTSVTIGDSVTSIGKCAFSNCYKLTTITIPNSVTSIGESAFSNCYKLTTITIPNSVTSIGKYAFSYCSSLTTITIPNSITTIENNTFSECSSLTTITIPNSVTSIGESAFSRCSSLTTITIPNSVTSIGQSAFVKCSSLTTITIPNSVTSIDKYAFSSCSSLTTITIPNSVTSIGKYAFSDCNGLTKVIISNSVTSIGDNAFRDCTSLSNVTIGNSVETIGTNAFYGCTALKLVINNSKLQITKGSKDFGYVGYYASKILKAGFIDEYGICYTDTQRTEIVSYIGNESHVTIPNSVTSIGNNAFMGCDFNSVTIPNSVTSIGEHAFSYNHGMDAVVIGNSVTNIGTNAFYDCAELKIVINLSNLNITAGSSSHGYVGYYAKNVLKDGSVDEYDICYSDSERTKLFSYFGNDYHLTIPNSVTSIGPSAFKSSNLRSVTIPNSVTSIGAYAFDGCSRLNSVTIGNSVANIGNNAFNRCDKLVKIIFLGNTPPENVNAAFTANNDRVTYVANDKYNNYSSVLGDIIKLTTLSSLFVIDGISYVPDNTAGVRTAIAIDYDYKTTNITIPNEVNYKTITLPVTKLGVNLLYGADIGTLTISENITEIEKMALPSSPWFSVHFADSEKDISMVTPIQSLYSLYIGRNIECSNGIVDITETGNLNLLEIAGFVTEVSIKDYKNLNQAALKELVLGKNVTTIGDGLFADCSLLESANLKADNIIIGNNAFENCEKLASLTIKPSTVSIGDYAFSGCASLNNNLLFENNLKRIGNYAFNECIKLKSLTINADNCIIGKNAFKSCTGIYNVTVTGNSNYLNDIGESAFEACTSLVSVNFADTKKCTIGKSAFKNCNKLQSISIPSGLKVLADSTFYNCQSINTFNLPETLTAIGSYSFYNVGKNLSLILPRGLKLLSNFSFFNSKFSQITFSEYNQISTIPESCFANCLNLTEFVIPKEITNIEASAFEANNIKSLRFDGSKNQILVDKTAFSGATINDLYIGRRIKSDIMLFSGNNTLRTLEVGEYKVAIDHEEFKNCTALTTVKTAPTTTSIGISAFNGCTSLNEVHLGENIALVRNTAFANSGIKNINFPRSWTKIEPYTFYNCKNLTEAILPETVTAIMNDAFSNSGVTNVSIPSSVSRIETNAFSNCSSLSTLTLNEGIAKVSEYAFASTAITDLTIPSSMIELSRGAFKNCTSLKSLNIVDGSDVLFIANDGSNNPMFMNSPIENVYIGRILEYNESSAAGYSPFYNNKSIKKVVIGDVPTQVYNYEFYKCSSIESATIGDGVTFFGENSFSGCTSLKDFTFGANVTKLGKESFSDCSNITQLRSYALNPPICDDQAIVDINTIDCELFVPTQSLEKYQAAEQWREFWFINSFDADLKVSFIEFDQSSVLLEKGKTHTLKPTVYPANAITKTLRWHSSNPDIASVSNDGVITAIEDGETDIYAYSTDGSEIAACCHISVFNPYARKPYKFSIGNVKLSDTGTTSIPVLMANDGEITAFMCDIKVSDGLSIVVDDEDFAEFTLSERANHSHILASNKIADDTYRIVAYSSSLAVFDGNNGELFYIPVYKNGVSKNYTIEITNIIATSPESVDYIIPSVNYDFNNVPQVNKGDVNSDGKITTGDVTSVVTYILLETPAVFNFDAADVNSDNSITTGDVTSIVSMILNNVSIDPVSATKAYAVNSNPARDIFVVENAIVNGNSVSVSISMNGSSEYVATQFDVIVPQGLRLVDVVGCNANAYSHEFLFNEYAENVCRVIIYSGNNKNFTGSEQFELVFEGDNFNEDLTVNNAIVTAIEDNQIKDIEAQSLSFNVHLCAVGSIHDSSLKVWTEGNTLYIKGEEGLKVNITNSLGISKFIVLDHNVYSETLADGVYIVNNKKVILK